MKSILLILSSIILPIIVLNNGVLLHMGNDRSVIAASVSKITTRPVLPASTAQIQVTSYTSRNPTTLPTAAFSALNNFAATLKNGQAGKVVGVYVSSVLALNVAQQPINNPSYVNPSLGYATQFSLATKYGSTGLLAHNYLSGALFFNLLLGQEVDVIYGDRLIRRYTISIIRHLQAISPLSSTSNFVNIDDPNSPQISNADLFYQTYGKGDRVVFQTCINANGNTSWGRLFVIAVPIP